MTAPPSLSLSAVLGLETRFLVTVDGIDLGGWGKCSGLEVSFNPVKIEEGGNYDYKPILPGQMDYSNIRLERAISAGDSQKVQAWLSSRVYNWVHAPGSQHGIVGAALGAAGSFLGTGALGAALGAGGTAQITLCDANGKPLITWSLRGVYPNKWTGPNLSSSSAGIAMETLELCHEGFL